MKIQRFMVFILFVFYTSKVFSQADCCNNVGFESGNIGGWIPYKGIAIVPADSLWTPFVDTVTNVSVLARNQHVINTISVVDSFCSNDACMTSLLPNSGNSVRIGNAQSGYGASRMDYVMTVDACNTGLLYSYALVLQDPGHPAEDQPRFDVRITDTLGNVLGGSCGIYSVYAGSDPSFHQGTNNVLYKCWSSVCVDLRAFVGQKVVASFRAQDCGQGAHFGYAYIDARCIPLMSRATICPGAMNLVQLIAPDGFSGYQWYTPDGLPITTQGGNSDTCFYAGVFLPGDTFKVELTSIPGCVSVMNVVLDNVPLVLQTSVTTGNCPFDSAVIHAGSNNGSPGYYFTALNQTNNAFIADSSSIPDFNIQVGDGNYIVTLTDSAGCRTSDTLLISHPPFDTLIASSQFCMGDTSLFLTPPAYSIVHAPYEWYSYPDYTALNNEDDSLLALSPYAGQSYYVTWADDNNCIRRSLVSIESGGSGMQFKPEGTLNVFTPNGDGKNERFMPYYSENFSGSEIDYYAGDYSIKIYNRWGNKVFESNNYVDAWDGTFQNNNCAAGVYYWIATYQNRCGDAMSQPIEHRGVLHLIRK